MYWDQLTSPQVDALDRNIPAILPVSATEQHGAHLPLATDRLIGEHFCQKLDEQIGEQVLILPSVGIGCSEHHKDFAGSLSVQHQTFLQQLTDIADCVAGYGFKNLLVLNSHGGNQAIGQSFVEIYGYRHPELNLAIATWWRIAAEALHRLNDTGPGGAGHAGEFETSLMLLIAPNLVHLDQLQSKANVPTLAWAEGDLLRGPKAGLYRRMKEMTPNGVYGEPSAGTREKGEKITAIVVPALQQIILDMYQLSQ